MSKYRLFCWGSIEWPSRPISIGSRMCPMSGIAIFPNRFIDLRSLTYSVYTSWLIICISSTCFIKISTSFTTSLVSYTSLMILWILSSIFSCALVNSVFHFLLSAKNMSLSSLKVFLTESCIFMASRFYLSRLLNRSSCVLCSSLILSKFILTSSSLSIIILFFASNISAADLSNLLKKALWIISKRSSTLYCRFWSYSSRLSWTRYSKSTKRCFILLISTLFSSNSWL